MVFKLGQWVCWLALINYDHLHILPIFKLYVCHKLLTQFVPHWMKNLKTAFFCSSVQFQVCFKYILFFISLILLFTHEKTLTHTHDYQKNPQILITIHIIVCTQIFSGNFFFVFGIFLNYSFHISLLINNLWTQFEMRQKQSSKATQCWKNTFFAPLLSFAPSPQNQIIDYNNNKKWHFICQRTVWDTQTHAVVLRVIKNVDRKERCANKQLLNIPMKKKINIIQLLKLRTIRLICTSVCHYRCVCAVDKFSNFCKFPNCELVSKRIEWEKKLQKIDENS